MKRRIHKKEMMFLALAAATVLVSCNRTRNNPGYDYFPDMFYSFAYESYSPDPGFGDVTSMRTPAHGTVPMDMIPFAYAKTPEDAVRAGLELKNPVEMTPGNVARGKEGYEVYCQSCHGEAGDGRGYLYTSGRYKFPPASLRSETVRNQPDGQIFHSITRGIRIMGAHGAMIPQTDRWKVVHYIRHELQK